MNILLCCAAGMSTSLLVTKMEKAAQAQGIEAKIWAVSGSEVRNHIDEADVLLLGPQVRYLLPKMKELCKEKGIPVDVIQSVHYGLCNGEAVLQAALSMKS
ncbi:PTS sugar transporter subunit IIB [Bacillus sp. AFS018417]|uniref:PTS sugar transporter subunit IIB n=1 Tax=Bacillus TaxID=1386 RepID=UPI000BF82B4B|nr:MULTISPECIES: PTS sugar transporter subunit IIB [unclassified Bacillus (in: firmicutes)]MCP1126040.1 PTS sugar transporter subunit IIB [Bacillus sp. 3103sda1]PEZ01523.1 PTS sugar transporter subunit IIB [Bacillus sp. AFS018417]